MTEPVVFISEFEVQRGAEGSLRTAAAGVSEMIRTSKPRTALFAVYLDEPGATVRFVHAFPDARSLQVHFEGFGDRASTVAEILAPARFELYGEAPPGPLDQLRRDADVAGVKLTRFPSPIAGFLRNPA